MNTQKCEEVVRNAVRVSTAKEIGRLAGVSHRTVERWQRGETAPDAPVLVMLMSKSRAIAEAVMRATTDEWQKAEESRLLAELAALKERRRDVETLGAVGRLTRRASDIVVDAALGASAALSSVGGQKNTATHERADAPASQPLCAGSGDGRTTTDRSAP
jgi:transcriptional regulator with XRE-family HTH domain